MEINITDTDRNILVTLAGRLDTLQANECEERLRPLRDQADREIILDCTALEYISSSGLRIFLSLLKDVKAKGGFLQLRNVNNEIRNIFTITGFHRLFNIQ